MFSLTYSKVYHRAFGVYGVCINEGKLLVIDKNRGPYSNRFDLPGGSLEEGESLTEALHREVIEETGYSIHILKQIGTSDFKLPWKWKTFTHVHHIAVFYHIELNELRNENLESFDDQDSLGISWISKQEITKETASPLVLKAWEWRSHERFNLEVDLYNEWTVKE